MKLMITVMALLVPLLSNAQFFVGEVSMKEEDSRCMMFQHTQKNHKEWKKNTTEYYKTIPKLEPNNVITTLSIHSNNVLTRIEMIQEKARISDYDDFVEVSREKINELRSSEVKDKKTVELVINTLDGIKTALDELLEKAQKKYPDCDFQAQYRYLSNGTKEKINDSGSAGTNAKDSRPKKTKGVK